MKRGRTRLSGEQASREHFKCPVPSCKLTPRADNFESHIKSKVIFDDNGNAVKPSALRTSNLTVRNHTKFFYEGGYNLINLPKLTKVSKESLAKQNLQTIDNLLDGSQKRKANSDTNQVVNPPPCEANSAAAAKGGGKISFPPQKTLSSTVERPRDDPDDPDDPQESSEDELDRFLASRNDKRRRICSESDSEDTIEKLARETPLPADHDDTDDEQHSGSEKEANNDNGVQISMPQSSNFTISPPRRYDSFHSEHDLNPDASDDIQSLGDQAANSTENTATVNNNNDFGSCTFSHEFKEEVSDLVRSVKKLLITREETNNNDNSENCWYETDEMFECIPCTRMPLILQPYMKERVYGNWGKVRKEQYGWRVHSNMKKHELNPKHLKAVKEYELYLLNKKSSKVLNEKAIECLLINAAHCLLSNGSSEDFVRLNNCDQIKGEIFGFLPANRNNSNALFFEYRDCLFQKLSDVFKHGIRNVRHFSVTLDKVTCKRTSYTVICTFFFFEGKIYVYLNKVHKMSSSDYTAAETCEMLGTVLCETLGLDKEGIFIHLKR